MHRVNTLITHLIYGKVSPILPKEKFFTKVPTKGGTLLSWAKQDYSQHGMFIDYHIRSILARQHSIPLEDGIDIEWTPTQLYQWVCQRFYGGMAVATEKDFHSPKNQQILDELETFIQTEFKLVKGINLDTEWDYDTIQGHPDIVTFDTIYDIKTTGWFNRMRTSTILQLMSYACLAALNGKNFKYVGVILPAQKMVIRHDISKWNSEPFWRELQKCIQTKIMLTPSADDIFLFQTMIAPHAGCHVSKMSTILRTVQSFSYPIQIFLHGHSTNLKITAADIKKTHAYIGHTGKKCYVHAPYSFNLSKVHADGWGQRTLNTFMQTTVKLNFRGLVVHCGIQKKGTDYNEVYINMYESVIYAAEHATPDCPLLVETSAGETGELLSDIDDLILFYQILPSETQANVAICVDTCHVFSAGYDPMDAIERLVLAQIPIKLIHYNDSKFEKGCCKDRHEMIGRGHIGLKKLNEVGLFAIANGIPCVHE